MNRLSRLSILSLLSLSLSTQFAQAMFAGMDADITVATSNTMQDQSYLDNYHVNHGNGPLTSVKYDTAMTLSNAYNSKSLLDVKLAYYNQIKTYNVGIGITQRMISDAGLRHAFYGAVDYTKYDEMDFYQAVLGGELNYDTYKAALNIYMPMGSVQVYPGAMGSTLTGMKGGDFHFTKQFDALTLGVDFGYFSEDTVKNDLQSAALTASYQFSQNLIIGGQYEYRHGLDSEDIGYKAYLAIPLSRDQHARASDSLSTAPVKRMLGSLIQAESLDCGAGMASYASYGNTICASTNPFNGAMVCPLKSGVSLTSGGPTGSSGTITFKKDHFYLINSSMQYDTITVESGAVLAFTDNGFILAKAANSSIGEAGAKLKATFLAVPQFGYQIVSSKVQSLQGVIHFLDRVGSIAKTAANSSVSSTAPSYFMALTGNAFMDFATQTTLETDATQPLIADLQASASAAAGTRNSVLTATAGMLQGQTMGGDTGSTNDFVDINNVNFGNRGIMLLGANARLDKVNFAGGNHAHIYQVGGILESTNTAHRAENKTQAFVIGRGGAQYFGANNLYDQSQAKESSFKGIQSKDPHNTIGAVSVAGSNPTTGNSKVPQITVVNSTFNMGSVEAAAKRYAISISEQNTSATTGGVGLVLLGNVVNMPGVTTTLAVGQSDQLFADIPSSSGSATNKFGLQADATVAGGVLIAGHNLVGASGADADDLLAYGMGLGQITQPGSVVDSIFSYKQGGQAFAFGLEGCQYNVCSGFMPSDFLNTDLAEPGSPVELISESAMRTALADYIKPQAGAITAYADVTNDFYQHASGMPSTISGRAMVNVDAYTSRLGSNPSITSADDGAANTTEVWRNASTKANFLTGANTLWFNQMVEQVIVQALPHRVLPDKDAVLERLANQSSSTA